MDTPDPTPHDRAPVCRFGPDRRLTAGTGALTAVAAASAALADDQAGRLLLALAALVLLAYTVTDLLFWPRLTASAAGIEVRSPGTRRDYRWDEVESVHADARDRLGLRSVTLEIDAAEDLHVFSRRALGADPEEVAVVLTAMNPHSP